MVTSPTPKTTAAQENVIRLEELVGRTLTGLVSGTKDRTNVDHWIDGSKTPDQSESERIALALELLDAVAEHESMSVARSWFTGANTFVEGKDTEMAPALAIGDGFFSEVRSSAQRFIEDGWE